jgi:oxygen-independent coproporphyrinogen III oxidase
MNTAIKQQQVTPTLAPTKLVWAADDPPQHLAPAEVFEAGLRLHHIANTAYPIAHRKTIWSYRQPAERHAALLRDALAAAPGMSLYVHIPFCEQRCRYCEYTVASSRSPAIERDYVAALQRELQLYLELLGQGSRTLAGLDFGGGTPALIEPGYIGCILDQIAAGFRLAPGFGISIETTPRIAATRPERMRALRALGIERISMGLQTVSRRLLQKYGRDLNDVGYNRRAADNIRAAGFERFNVDVMYGFAEQSVDDVRATIEHALALGPEVITLYRMRYKGTAVRREADAVPLAQVVAMYDAAFDLLTSRGYAANPGKNGFCRVPGEPGTSAYLTERVVNSTPYLGLGLGAQTFTNNLLGYNLGAASKQLAPYLDAIAASRLPLQDLYWLPPAEAMAKMIAVAFYFGEIPLAAFRTRFGVELSERFAAEVEFVTSHGLMAQRGDRLQLTRLGSRSFNGVVALFYSDRVKQHLLES